MRFPRRADLWLPGLLRASIRKAISPRPRGLTHIVFCIADHYEPDHGRANLETERRRVRRWVREYPRLFDRFRDADGRPPQHTFFFPAEAYRAEHLDALADLCGGGFGEVEVHLHHAHDTEANVRETLVRFRDTLAERHGLLSVDRDGRIVYGFIHGNWALDNGREDPASCGVNSELTVLRETGCYADFTMPAAPDPAQSRIVNQIYYATDDPKRPRSYDRGVPARVGKSGPANALLMIQGPLSLYRSASSLAPRMDNGALDASPGHHPTIARFARWVSAGISVQGRRDWIFVKVYSHGAKEPNADVLLGDTAVGFHEALQVGFNDGRRYALHYVTSRELANIVHAAEAGMTGNPGDYRDFCIIPISRRTRPVTQVQ